MPVNNQHGFARREMKKRGWADGKGLGKAEDGMKDAIKVKMKNNTGGLGHNEGTQFTFHWWDHIFNKAANSIKVSEGEDGVQIEKCEGKKITPVLISNKRPLSSKYANATLLYGTFVKSGTYHSDSKQLADSLSENDSSDESSDDEEEKSPCDTLDKTFKKTGLSGHKAARHGFGLCGKLQRLENQEQSHENISKNGAKNVTGGIAKDSKDVSEYVTNVEDKFPNESIKESCKDGTMKKKKKKKRKSIENDLECGNSVQVEKTCKNEDKESQVVTKEKKKSICEFDEKVISDADVGTDKSLKKRKKAKKQKVKDISQDDVKVQVIESETTNSCLEAASDPPTKKCKLESEEPKKG